MIYVRKSEDRGDANHGWLHSKHTFSFAGYYDEKHMGFGPLRVINEDRIEGGCGFDTHSHSDMEILSYVLEGALKHQDSMGNAVIIRPGEVQRMSAGTGVSHSEYNELKDGITHFLQIWIVPDQLGVTPSYGQKNFESDFKRSDWVLVASQNGRNGSISLNQGVDMFIVQAQTSGETMYKTFVQHRLWVQVVRGELRLEGTLLKAGDGAGIEKVEKLSLGWAQGSEFILFDMV